MESIREIGIDMKSIIDVITCIFEVFIFDVFFKGVMQRKHKYTIYNLIIYLFAVGSVFLVNSFNNSKLNLIANIVIYFIILVVAFEGSIKETIFYFIIFYTAFAGVEIIFEFLLSLILGENYRWSAQNELFKLIVCCLEKLTIFIILFIIKKRLNKEEYGMDNKLLICSSILPISTFGIYSALLYSHLMEKLSGLNEMILVIGCVFLLISNAIIFLMFDYIFRLNKEKQTLEISSLKTDMEKKYYDRMEAVNIEQAHYMHDFKFLLKTIGDLAIQEQNEEIKSVIQDMKIRIGEIEDELFCRNKVLNTILCEKKREANDNNITYNAYVEPGIDLNFIQDIDIIIIMGNIIDNALEACEKVEDGYVDINIFGTQKGHFLVMKVENKFDGVLKRQGKKFYSTKESSSKHGMGIENVRNCIEKYGGFLQTEVEDNIFTASVIFTVL